MNNVACGNKAHAVKWPAQVHHYTASQVRECFATQGGLWTVEDEDAQHQDWLDEYDADAAYERHLEDAGHEEAMLQDRMEAEMGVIPFDEAMANAARAAEARADTSIPVGNSHVIPDGDEVLAWAKAEGDTKPQVVFDGIYTVERPDGTHRTFRLRTQSTDDKFAPGKQVVSYLNGPDNERDFVGFGFVKDGRLVMWKAHRANLALQRDSEILLADPDNALKSAHCFDCHRTLTVPTSLYAGRGPECQRKHQ